MKRLSGCGLIAGVLIGAVAALVFWISLLPGAPSQYGPRFPIAEEALPTNAYMRASSGTVGFDVYTNVKVPPIIKKSDILPVVKHETWHAPIQQGGYVSAGRTIWIEYDGRLYRICQFDKRVPRNDDREARFYYHMTRELSIDESRRIAERVNIPELGFEETFGPFPLP